MGNLNLPGWGGEFEPEVSNSIFSFLAGAYQTGHLTVKSSARVGYLNVIFDQGGGNLNKSIFKSSNARRGVGAGGNVDVTN